MHYAVATSVAYLQSTYGESGTAYRWSHGPLKQVDAEVWLDSLAAMAEVESGGCDHRISNPGDLLGSGSISSYRILQASRWRFEEPDEEGRSGGVDMSYAQLARTMGGCPENLIGGRFKVLSILTTATQLGFVREVCNPSLDPEAAAAPIQRLLPPGMTANTATSGEVAQQVAAHQFKLFFGREAEADELDEARVAGEECALTRCTAEEFARPYCFALLSSSEMLFY